MEYSTCLRTWNRRSIKKVIEGANSETIIPIHTEHEELFDTMHSNVRKVRLNEKLEIN